MSHHDIESFYDTHVAALPEGERLRLVELITRGLAGPAASPAGDVGDRLAPVAGWRHAAERRGDLNEWSDRTL